MQINEINIIKKQIKIINKGNKNETKIAELTQGILECQNGQKHVSMPMRVHRITNSTHQYHIWFNSSLFMINCITKCFIIFFWIQIR